MDIGRFISTGSLIKNCNDTLVQYFVVYVVRNDNLFQVQVLTKKLYLHSYMLLCYICCTLYFW